SDLGVVPPFMFAVVVAAARLTAFTTPLALRAAPRLLSELDRRLPPRLRANLTLYSAWVDALRHGEGASPLRRKIRRTLRVLVLDALAVAALAIGSSLGLRPAAAGLASRTGVAPAVATAGVLLGRAVVGVPFARPLLRPAPPLGRPLGPDACP